jgi:hypothetical protein
MAAMQRIATDQWHAFCTDELESLNTGPNPFNVQGKCSDNRASNFAANSTVFFTDLCLYPVVRSTPGAYSSMHVPCKQGIVVSCSGRAEGFVLPHGLSHVVAPSPQA